MKEKMKFEQFGIPWYIILPIIIEICTAIIVVLITIIQLVSRTKILDYCVLLFMLAGCTELMFLSCLVFDKWQKNMVSK